MELEDFIKSYAGKIAAPIGKKIVFFKYLFHEIDDTSEPVLAWMKTHDNVWHRFFIDTWIPHWKTLNQAEAIQCAKDTNEDSIEDHIKEELEEYIDDNGGKYKAIDMLKLYPLQGKEIKDASVEYLRKDDSVMAQLKLLIEEDIEILVNDFGDIIDAELIINNKKIINISSEAQY